MSLGRSMGFQPVRLASRRFVIERSVDFGRLNVETTNMSRAV